MRCTETAVRFAQSARAPVPAKKTFPGESSPHNYLRSDEASSNVPLCRSTLGVYLNSSRVIQLYVVRDITVVTETRRILSLLYVPFEFGRRRFAVLFALA